AGNTALCRTLVFVPHDQMQPPPRVTAATNEADNRGSAGVPDTPVVTPGETAPTSGHPTVQSTQLFLPVVAATVVDRHATEPTVQTATPVTTTLEVTSENNALTDTAAAPAAQPEAGANAGRVYVLFLPVVNR